MVLLCFLFAWGRRSWPPPFVLTTQPHAGCGLPKVTLVLQLWKKIKKILRSSLFPAWQHKNVSGKHQGFQLETWAIDVLSATSGPCIYRHHSDEFGCTQGFISNLWSKSVILKCVRVLRGWNTPRQSWNECAEESYRGKQAAIVKNKRGSISGGRVTADDVEPSCTNPTAQSKQMYWGLKITLQDTPEF